MARITVEDCLKNVENRFDLVLLASERSHDLNLRRAEAKTETGNDKCTVTALREIAAGLVTRTILEEEKKAAEDPHRLFNSPPEPSTTESEAPAAESESPASEEENK